MWAIGGEWGTAYLRARLAQRMDEDSIGLFHAGRVLTLLGLGPGPDQRKWSNAVATALRAHGGHSITCRARNVGKCSSTSECCASEMPWRRGLLHTLRAEYAMAAGSCSSSIWSPAASSKGKRNCASSWGTGQRNASLKEALSSKL